MVQTKLDTTIKNIDNSFTYSHRNTINHSFSQFYTNLKYNLKFV